MNIIGKINVITYLLIIFLLVLALFILSNEKLSKHPYRLYAIGILLRIGNLSTYTISKYIVLFPKFYIMLKPDYFWRYYILREHIDLTDNEVAMT